MVYPGKGEKEILFLVFTGLAVALIITLYNGGIR